MKIHVSASRRPPHGHALFEPIAGAREAFAFLTARPLWHLETALVVALAALVFDAALRFPLFGGVAG